MITRSTYPGWHQYPVYHANTHAEYREVCQWMAKNQVEEFLLSSGSGGCLFQVKSNIGWFMLKWG